MPFVTRRGDGSLELCIYVQPRASRTGLCGVHGEALKMAIAAPPVDGKANKEVVAYLASVLQIPKREIAIIGGLQSRTKRCRIGLLTEETMRERIAAAMAP